MEKKKDMSYLLSTDGWNGWLEEFRGASDQMINNFLRNSIPSQDHKQYGGSMDYKLITPNYIKSLIKIDEVLRASTSWNEEPLTVYRGASRLNGDSLRSLVSTSLEPDVAVSFYNGVFLKINLPAGFPHIKVFNVSEHATFNSEKEVILPPCDFEIVDSYPLQHQRRSDKSQVNLNCYELKLTPKNLAECLLERMNNPPEDYFDEFDERDREKFERAKIILKDYVENYVKTGTFKYFTSLNQSTMS